MYNKVYSALERIVAKWVAICGGLPAPAEPARLSIIDPVDILGCRGRVTWTLGMLTELRDRAVGLGVPYLLAEAARDDIRHDLLQGMAPVIYRRPHPGGDWATRYHKALTATFVSKEDNDWLAGRSAQPADSQRLTAIGRRSEFVKSDLSYSLPSEPAVAYTQYEGPSRFVNSRQGATGHFGSDTCFLCGKRLAEHTGLHFDCAVTTQPSAKSFEPEFAAFVSKNWPEMLDDCAQPSAKPAGVDFGDDSYRRAKPAGAGDAVETLAVLAKFLGIDEAEEKARPGYDGRAPVSHIFMAAIERFAARTTPAATAGLTDAEIDGFSEAAHRERSKAWGKVVGALNARREDWHVRGLSASDSAVAFIASAPPSAELGVANGFVSVPLEMTHEMLHETWRGLAGSCDHITIREAYRRMLKAAPTTPSAPVKAGALSDAEIVAIALEKDLICRSGSTAYSEHVDIRPYVVKFARAVIAAATRKGQAE